MYNYRPRTVARHYSSALGLLLWFLRLSLERNRFTQLHWQLPGQAVLIVAANNGFDAICSLLAALVERFELVHDILSGAGVVGLKVNELVVLPRTEPRLSYTPSSEK